MLDASSQSLMLKMSSTRLALLFFLQIDRNRVFECLPGNFVISSRLVDEWRGAWEVPAKCDNQIQE